MDSYQSGATLPPKPNGISDEEWAKHIDIMNALGNYEVANEEPFFDQVKLADPRADEWRGTLHNLYNFNKNGKEERT
jgi:hypothetical protein